MAGRFNAANVNANPDKTALKTLLTGGSGVGKTWFVSTITNDDGSPVFFLPVEEGLKGNCPDARPMGFKDERDRWVVPMNIGEFHMALNVFMTEVNVPVDVVGPDGKTTKRRPYRHLAIDSLTGIETLVNEATCGVEKVRHMEDKDYGKVWSAAFPYWQAVQRHLDDVRRTGVNIWLIAHSRETYDASVSSGDVFKRWDLALRGSKQSLDDLRQLWRAWADNVFFVLKDISVAKGDKNKRAMAKLGGRVLITAETGSIYAKSRLPIPPRIPATWPDLQRAMRSGTPVKVDKTREQIASIAAQLEPDDRAAIEADLTAAKTPTQVAAALSRAQGMLAMLDSGDEGGEEPPAGQQENGAGPKTDEDRAAAIDQGRE